MSLRLGEHHWSELDLWLGENHQEYLITHTFNSPLDEIANALRALVADASEVSITLHEEPGRHVWELVRAKHDNDLLLVAIRSYEDNFNESKAPIATTEFQVRRDYFVDTFLAELNKISMQLRYTEFANDRSPEEFPWATWREIRRTQNGSEQDKAQNARQSPG